MPSVSGSSPFVELAPGIFRVPTLGRDFINSFVFTEPSGELTLVDAGLKRAPRRLLAALEAMGKAPSDVTRLVLTHAHADHPGGAARMKRETGAPIHAHVDEARYTPTGLAPPPDRRSFVARVLALVSVRHFEAFDVDETFADGDLLDVAGGLRVIHTPGHTPGHVSLLHEPSGVLLTGDALFNWFGRTTFSMPLSCSDVPLSRETAHRLGDVDYEVAAFMHGPEIRGDARRHVTDFLARRLRRS